MTMERISASHAKDRAHDAYQCSKCRNILQVRINQPGAGTPFCVHCAYGSRVRNYSEGGNDD